MSGDADEDLLEVAHPGDDRAVVEADRELHPHLHASTNAFHDPNEVGSRLSRGHEVDDSYEAGVRLEIALEDEGVAAVSAAGRAEVALGLDRPVPVFALPEQRSEDRARVEARHAQPVDAAAAAHERCRLEISDQTVVLDERHP